MRGETFLLSRLGKTGGTITPIGRVLLALAKVPGGRKLRGFLGAK
jgi:hypothetical protein